MGRNERVAYASFRPSADQASSVTVESASMAYRATCPVARSTTGISDIARGPDPTATRVPSAESRNGAGSLRRLVRVSLMFRYRSASAASAITCSGLKRLSLMQR